MSGDVPIGLSGGRDRTYMVAQLEGFVGIKMRIWNLISTSIPCRLLCSPGFMNTVHRDNEMLNKYSKD